MATPSNVGLNIAADGTSLFADVTVTYTAVFGANEQVVSEKVELLGVGPNEPGQPDRLATLAQASLQRPAGQTAVNRTVAKQVDLRVLDEDIIGADEIQAKVTLTQDGQTRVGLSNVVQINARQLINGRA